ncbi:gag protease polyprotein [Cucumis melo var. makuwa]|uniref:Gag protease polyprotein n=1 Tax=Cucumis melo var. makuwa TaxID=1194695 RepID=A0A5A7VQA1_CUCMM|nr:gag protease polyprotein [Cucumis melo var. makuwa]
MCNAPNFRARARPPHPFFVSSSSRAAAHLFPFRFSAAVHHLFSVHAVASIPIFSVAFRPRFHLRRRQRLRLQHFRPRRLPTISDLLSVSNTRTPSCVLRPTVSAVKPSSSAAWKQSQSSDSTQPRHISVVERPKVVVEVDPLSVDSIEGHNQVSVTRPLVVTCALSGIRSYLLIDPDAGSPVRAQRGADRREAGRTREGHMDASSFLIASSIWYQSTSFRFCRLAYNVSLCFVSLWLKRSLPLVREMPPRRSARRGGRGGRGRGAGRVQPEVQPVAQATDPAAPVTHADLAAME